MALLLCRVADRAIRNGEIYMLMLSKQGGLRGLLPRQLGFAGRTSLAYSASKTVFVFVFKEL